MKNDSKTFSLIIPAKNESENLKIIIPKIDLSLFSEVIIVDGNSKDDTIKTTKELIPDVKIVNQISKGKGAGMIEGANKATGDVIIFIDADGSMDPNEILLIIEKILEGYEFVKGTRKNLGGDSEDITKFRDFGNTFFTKLTNVLYKTDFSDLCYGFFGIDRMKFLDLDLTEKEFGIEAEVAIKSKKKNYKIIEFPSIEKERIHGSSNLNSIKDGWKILRTIIKNRFK